MALDLAKLRLEYEDHGLTESEIGDCPFEAFHRWLHLAIEQSPGPWFEANAMTLATSDQDGHVTARIVLLKQLHADTFTFFTNYESQKGRQLAENPRGALVFHWPHLGRQVRVEGMVRQTSREISEAYFRSRPRGSQIGAAASEQSVEIPGRDILERAAEEIVLNAGDGPIPFPEHWGGYELSPERIEFWQGRTNRLHDRINFERTGNGSWRRFRVAP